MIQHHLAAVCFADLVGYSRLAGEDEALAMREVETFQAVARQAIDENSGRIVKFVGDAVLAEFPSTGAAVRAAHAMRERFREQAERLGVRVGVHVGDVRSAPDGDLYGDGVNVAARIQTAADPGEVLVSEDVWRQLRQRQAFRFEERGVRELKGVADPPPLFAVVDVEDPEAGDEERASGATRTLIVDRPVLGALAVASLLLVGFATWWSIRDRGNAFEPATVFAESAAPGIAILPFSVNDPELSTWREGMVDLLATNLDGAAGLRAISSRTVLSRWRQEVEEGGTPDLPAALGVARSSGARYAIVGSVLTGANAMRVVADAYDLETGETLGQERVEGVPDSIFGLVDDLSIRLLGRVLERESPTARFDLARVTTRSVPALKAFLEGEALSRSSSFRDAIPAYEEAVLADSTFALAYYRMSWALGWLESAGGTKARAAIERAMRFEDRLPERERDFVHVSEAYYDSRANATELAIAATERYPDDPIAWFLLGEVRFHLPFQSLARRNEQDAAFGRATQLDPTFTPAYIHPLDNAFRYADRIAADTLLTRYRQRAAGTEYDRKYETVWALMFADSMPGGAITAMLDSLSTEVLGRVIGVLIHPSATPIRQRAISVWRTRPDTGAGPGVLYVALIRTLDGRTKAALEAALAIGQRELYLQLVLGFYYFGYPIDLETVLLEEPPEEPTGDTLVEALVAIETGQEARVDSLRALTLEWAERVEARSDTTLAEGMRTGVTIVEGREAMLRGRDEEALEILEPVLRETPEAFFVTGWLIELLTRLDRVDEAIRIGEVAGPNPWIAALIAPLYEQVGEIDKAIEAYGWIASSWENGDAWLQPHVVEARRAIARLRGLQRG